jgi:hypothetical protein
MTVLLRRAEDILRGNLRFGDAAPASENDAPGAVRHLVLVLLVFGLLYGAVMGTFGGFVGERSLQIVFSAVKVPLLLILTFLLSLPSFFVLNTLLGLRDDFGEALRAVAATQSGLTVVLASLAPCTLLWYASSTHYQSAILFNAVMFGIASIASQRLLRRFYAPLIARDVRHRLLLRVWLLLYAFVGIQMGWLLRPFIGNPGEPVRFFREGAWGNAYLAVLQMMGEVVR